MTKVLQLRVFVCMHMTFSPSFRSLGVPQKGEGGPDPTDPLALDLPLRNVLEEGDIAKCTRWP